jgi:hypothetical protein
MLHSADRASVQPLPCLFPRGTFPSFLANSSRFSLAHLDRNAYKGAIYFRQLIAIKEFRSVRPPQTSHRGTPQQMHSGSRGAKPMAILALSHFSSAWPADQDIGRFRQTCGRLG